jgi:photosystem II stability/assembly factor-like uncharacterized protein
MLEKTKLKRISFLTLALLVLLSCDEKIGNSNSTDTILGVGKKATIIQSTDGGSNWEKATVAEEAKKYKTYNIDFSSADYGKGKWIAVGGFGSGAVHNATIVMSEDEGKSWMAIDNPGTSKLFDVKFHKGSFIAVGNNENILLSKDGETWTKIDPKLQILGEGDPQERVTRIFNKLYAKDGRIFIMGVTKITFGGYTSNYPIILESTDGGLNWISAKNIGSDPIKEIKFGNNVFVGLGGGSVAKFEHETWSSDNRSGKPRIYPPLIYNNNKFCAFSSTRGSTSYVEYENNQWVKKGASKYNLGISTLMQGNGKLVFIGSEMPLMEGYKGVRATIYTSAQDTINWKLGRESLGDVLKGRGCNFNTGIFAQGKFIIAGSQDRSPGTKTQIFTSKDGLDWKESKIPELEIEEKILRFIKAN